MDSGHHEKQTIHSTVGNFILFIPPETEWIVVSDSGTAAKGLTLVSSKTSALKMQRCKGNTARRTARASSGRFKARDIAALTAEWEARLKRMGLGMDAGHNRSVITYGHMVADLDWDGKVTYKPPTGERLDNDEWPISLC